MRYLPLVLNPVTYIRMFLHIISSIPLDVPAIITNAPPINISAITQMKHANDNKKIKPLPIKIYC